MTTIPKRRCLQFSLRGLLTAFAVAALLAWVYAIGWNLWEQRSLERAVKSIHRGDTFGEALLAIWPHDEAALMSSAQNRSGTQYGWIRCEWPNAIYLFVGALEQPPNKYLESCKLADVKVYRFPATPRDYSPQTERGRLSVESAARDKQSGGPQNRPADIAYWYDSIDMLIGDNPTLDLKCELIHSD